MLTALAEWHPDLLVLGASSLSLGAMVEIDRLDSLLQALHDRFIGGG